MSSKLATATRKKGAQMVVPSRGLAAQNRFSLPQRVDSAPAAEDRTLPATLAEPELGHDFSQISIHPPVSADDRGATQPVVQSCPLALASPRACPFGGACHTCPVQVQTKLAIGQPDHSYEQEADRIADQIIRMPDPAIDGSQPDLAIASVQTKRYLQRSAEDIPEIDDHLESRLNQSRSGGSPLLDDVRAFMEPRFGFDFSRVQVHAGGEAEQLNRLLAAQAFTHGSDIYFGDGKYDPGSVAGKYLLAHELTHVVQQTGGVQAKRLADHPDVQMKYAACEAEEEMQRSLDISSAPELIQKRVVCDEWGENCQSVQDEEAYTPAQPEQNYTSDISVAATIPPSSEPTEPPPTLRSPPFEPVGQKPPNVEVVERGKLTPGKPFPPPEYPSKYESEMPTLRSPPFEPVGQKPPNVEVVERGKLTAGRGAGILSMLTAPPLIGAAVAAAILTWSKKTAPPWMDEVNPCTRKAYRSKEEYDEVHRKGKCGE